jgi:hypothetical protein
MFPLLLIDRNRAEALEPLGTKSKFWFSDVMKRRLLFKAEERGTGEDWAEKIGCELAELLGLPHVQYNLAVETTTNTPGVICASILEPGEALAHGNQLMFAADPTYPTSHKRFKVAAHTAQAVGDVVYWLRLPAPNWMGRVPAAVGTAIGVFAGYLMLDAWIANQDRHHENWAAVREIDGVLRLAPTFDHGASLARNLTDEERHERLTTKDRGRALPTFARRARSAIYPDAAATKPLTTVAAWRAIAARAPDAAVAWAERLGIVTDDQVRKIIGEIPPQRMSAVCKEFTLYLLNENRQRILTGEAE